ncbi:MAG: ABC transporter ATP-binding protein [Janthinobacterium lividum]
MTLLALEAADAFYGKAPVLHGVSLQVGAGEIVSLIGRNGAGKSTTLRVMAGLMPLAAGRLVFDGQAVSGWPAHRISRLGVAYVPETRRIFPNLSVQENLAVAGYAHRGRRGPWSLDRIYGLFPRLRERRDFAGDSLSGGEQQMLAIARGLMTAPRLLLLDEPTEGLAPRIVDDLVAAIRTVQAEGVAVVLVEQKLKVPMALASRQYVIENGRIAWTGTTAAMQAGEGEVAALLGF